MAAGSPPNVGGATRIRRDLAVPQSETTAMKIHDLLLQRDALLRHARLANFAFAHHRLAEFGTRITRAHLHGPVTLSLADPSVDRLWPVLLALEANQSVIEEHFTDEDIGELADILVFLNEGEGATEFTFSLEELAGRYLPGLQRELSAAGISLAQEAPSTEDSNRERG
jgi:hypothetical protein